MAKDLKLKPGWLARDIAAAAEQVKRLKTPADPRCINCQPEEPPVAEKLTHDEKMEIARKIMRRDYNILKELAD